MSKKNQIPVFNRIPMTLVKLFIARSMYRALKCFVRSDIHTIRRGGISFEVDLTEGIDLSIFLFGNFQKHITQNKYLSLKCDSVVLDIGANFGNMALRLAKAVPSGRIYAFEPTDYAFNRLLRNLSVNPDLSERITPVQSFVSDRSEAAHRIQAYASWKVDGTSPEAHPLHGGLISTSASISTVSIDDFCEKNDIKDVDLIKIDTDGHELKILRGARKTLEKFLPHIIFEIGFYLMEENSNTFELYFDYFSSAGYILANIKNGKPITLENYFRQIPLRATTNIIAIPPGRLV